MIYFKNIEFKTRDFSPLIKQVLAGVTSTLYTFPTVHCNSTVFAVQTRGPKPM